MTRISARAALVMAALAICALTNACRSERQAFAAGTVADSIRKDSITRARQDSINRAQPGYIVDSIFTPEEELRRFRTSLGGDSVTRFVGGSTSRRALVQRFIEALAANDTNDLRAMAVHAREFVDLYYPESPYSRPPYHQPPAFQWRMIQDPSNAGFTKLMQRLGGKPLRFVDERCSPRVAHEGAVTRYAGCLVVVVLPSGETATKRYFGSIVERDGQFKFLSYTNDF